MFNIEALDTSLQNLNNDDNTLAIIDNNKHDRKLTNILLTRLCIYSLFIRRQNGFTLSRSSPTLLPYVVIVDASTV
jgi:hypothetical protein